MQNGLGQHYMEFLASSVKNFLALHSQTYSLVHLCRDSMQSSKPFEYIARVFWRL